MVIFARSPKTRIFSKSAKGGPREIFRKTPKRRPRLKGPKPLLRKWHYPSISMHLNGRLEKILGQTAAPKMPEWPRYGNFCKVTGKPHFLKKCKRGTKGTFSKIAQEDALPKKAKKAEMALSSNQYALKVQILDKILAHKAAPKVPEWPSYGNFRQVTQTLIF